MAGVCHDLQGMTIYCCAKAQHSTQHNLGCLAHLNSNYGFVSCCEKTIDVQIESFLLQSGVPLASSVLRVGSPRQLPPRTVSFRVTKNVFDHIHTASLQSIRLGCSRKQTRLSITLKVSSQAAHELRVGRRDEPAKGRDRSSARRSVPSKKQTLSNLNCAMSHVRAKAKPINDLESSFSSIISF